MLRVDEYCDLKESRGRGLEKDKVGVILYRFVREVFIDKIV